MSKVHISGIVEVTPQGAPGVPTHPIYNPVYPDNSLPVDQPHPDQGLPGSQPRPDHTLPGGQGGRPDQGLPGSQPHPDQGLPGDQPGIWGPTDPRPTPPIYIPITPPSSGGVPTHPIYLPVYPSHPIVLPPNTPADVVKQIKAAMEFLLGNLPTDPNPKPTPVKK